MIEGASAQYLPAEDSEEDDRHPSLIINVPQQTDTVPSSRDNNHNAGDATTERSSSTSGNGNGNDIRTFQISVNDHWIEAFIAMVEEAHEVVLDVMDSLLHPFFMDADTLLIFSSALLVLDRVALWLSHILDEWIARTFSATTITATSRLFLTPNWNAVKLQLFHTMESVLKGASWGLYFDEDHLHRAARQNAIRRGCENDNDSLIPFHWLLPCGGQIDDNSSSFLDIDVDFATLVAPAVVVAGVGAILVNTSYFSTSLAPVYSWLLESHSLSTEVLLTLLLILFGLETVTALSFFLIGYKLISMHVLHLEDDHHYNRVTVTSLLTPPTDHYSNSKGNDTEDSILLDEANMMLVVSTMLWLMCVVTSKVVRMALYHSIGD